MGVAWMVNTVVLVFTLIAGLVVFLRLITRGVLLRNAGFEDVWSTFAMLCSVGLSVTFAIQIQNGMGMHIFDLTESMMTHSQKAFWASLLFYYLALTSTKLSILVQYLRIFPNERFRRVTLIAIAVVVIWGVWTLMGSIFICFPVNYFWDMDIKGKCLNKEAVWFTNAAINIAQDFIILIMPIPVLRSLSIPSKQKKALIIVFLFGGVVCIVSIVRLKSLVAISKSNDPTFDNLAPALLSAIEINVGIICACLPSMRPLLAAMMPVYFPDAKSRYSQNRATHDEEYVKDFKYPASSNVTYPVRAASRQGRSPGSNKIAEPYTPSYHSKMGHGSAYSSRSSSRSGSRAGSQTENVYRQTSGVYIAQTASKQTPHMRSSSQNSSRSSRNGDMPTQLENLYRGPPSGTYSPTLRNSDYSRPPTRTRNNSVPQDPHPPTYISHATLTHPGHGINGPSATTRHRSHSHASVHQQHHLHPLRLSPYSPSINSNGETLIASPETTYARLPKLPEHMASFDPFPTEQRTVAPLGPPNMPRRLVFHKPLPITPFPVQVAEKEKEAESLKMGSEETCEQCKTGICTLHLVVQH